MELRAFVFTVILEVDWRVSCQMLIKSSITYFVVFLGKQGFNNNQAQQQMESKNF